MSLAFITSDPVAAGYDAQSARLRRVEQEDQARNVDAAMRRGLASVYANQPEPPAAAPSPAPAPAAAGPGPSPGPAPAPAAAPPAPSPPAAGRPQAPAAAPAPAAAAQPAPAPQAPQAAAPQMPAFGSAPRPQSSNPLAGVVAELARTPGGGQAAMTAAVQGEGMATRRGAAGNTDRRQAERNAMVALGRGDETIYRYWAERAGINLPPEMVRDAGARQRVATGSLLAQRFYGTDRAQAQTFLQAYLRTGDAMQAATVAGEPRGGGAGGGRPRPGTWSAAWVRDAEGEERQLWTNTRDPSQTRWGVLPGGQAPAGAAGGAGTPPAAAAPGTAPGAPVTRAPAPARAGTPARPADRQVRYNMLVAAGMSPEEAGRVAGGAALSPNTIARVYASTVNAVAGDTSIPDAQRQAEVGRRMEAFGPNWRQALNPGVGRPAGAATPAPAAPAPAAAAPRPAAAPAAPAAPQRPASVPAGSAYSPSRSMWRDASGNLYDSSGRPVSAVPSGQ